MQITEIYKSIQGESTHAGLACVFVRLTGCNLRCSWCDSEYTFTGGQRRTMEEVMEEVERLSPGGGLVEITGGEPMLQERELVPLMQRLLDAGYTVLLETSGERPLERVPRRVIKIVDVKCPNSGEPDTFHLGNLDCLNSEDEVKFVLSDRGDYEFARDFVAQSRSGPAGKGGAVFPRFQQGGQRRARCVWLSAGSARTGGMDPGGWGSGAPGTADSQVYLGPGDEGGLGIELQISDCRFRI